VRFVDDEELAYVMQRYREVHDFWHVLCGEGAADVPGELALKWFEAGVTRLPSAALAAIAGPLALLPTPSDVVRTGLRAQVETLAGAGGALRDLLVERVPWALRAGSRAGRLMSVRYEECFEEDLSALRNRLRVEPMPGGDVAFSHSQGTAAKGDVASSKRE
jgi:ubiquinone biosynthesis protein COQ4